MADVFSLNCRGSINIHHDVLLRKYAGNAWHSGDTPWILDTVFEL